MTAIAYVSALVLAAVFVWAAAGKLARPARTATTFAALGVPTPAVAARVIAVVELALAALLAWRPRPGGLAALVLLAAFTAFLAARRRRGVTAGCGCFGSTAGGAAAAIEVTRNVLLALAAVVALGADAPVMPTLAAAVTVSVAAGLAAVVLALVRVKIDVGRLVANRLMFSSSAAGERRAFSSSEAVERPVTFSRSDA